MTAATLKERYDALRADPSVSKMRRASAYSAYFRVACEEGTPPDSLTAGTSLLDRFWERTAEGADHLYWLGAVEAYGQPRLGSIHVRRFVWTELLGHPPADRYNEVVRAGCGERLCVSPAHLILERRDKSQYRDEAIIGAAQVFYMRHGYSPSSADWRRHRMRPHVGPITRRWGTWARFIVAAGLPPVPHRGAGTFATLWPDEKIRAAIRAKVAELGRVPSAKEWDRNHWRPSVVTMRRRYGDWAAAKRAAGVE